MAVEKINEFVVATTTAILAMGGFLVKKLYNRIERVEDKLDDMEDRLLTREDIKQISDTQTLILQHLLEHRATEKTDVHK